MNRYPSDCPTGPCRRGGRAWSLPNVIKEEEVEGKSKDEEEIQDGLVVEEVMMVNFSLVPFLLVSFPCSSCCKIFPAKNKLSNHIVDMPNDLTSCIIC